MHKAVIVIVTLLIAISLTANSVQAQGFWDWVLSIFSPSTTPAGAFEILVPLLACSDTDLGRFYDEKGEIELLIEGKIITKTDFCDGDVLTEYYCDMLHTRILSTSINCKEYGNNYYCYDGACRKLEFIDLSVKDIVFIPNENPVEGDTRTVRAVISNLGDLGDSITADYVITDPNGIESSVQLSGSIKAGGETSVDTSVVLDVAGTWTFTVSVSPDTYTDADTSNNARTESIVVVLQTGEPFIDLYLEDIVFIPDENPVMGDTRTVRAVIENLGDLGDSFIVDYAITDPDGAESSAQSSGSVEGDSETSVDTSVVLDVAGTWTFTVSVTPNTYSDNDTSNNARAESIVVASETRGETFLDLSVKDIVFIPNENPVEGDTRTVRAVIENLGNIGDSFIVDYAITDPDGAESSAQSSGSVEGDSETSVDTSVVLDVAGTWTFSVNVTPDTYSDNDTNNNVRAESISVSEEQGDEPDTTPPAVTLTYPQNNAHVSEGTIVFRYTPSDPNLYACYFWAGTESMWEMIETDNNPISDAENTFTLLTYPGSYIWNIQCMDSNDNVGWGENFSIDIDTAPNNPPTTPTSLTPITGTYDINNSVISIECSGSEDADGDSVFYTIYAYYDSSWKTLEHGGNGEYDWTISRISSQSDVDLRCRATDLTDKSSYFNPEGKLEIDTVDMEDRQTHFACQNQQCAEVEGPGSDSCSSDYDCEIVYCGDGECDSWETPDTCSEDCEQGIYIDTEDGQYTSETPPLIKIFQLSDTKNGVRAIAIATDTENFVKDMVLEVFKEGTFQTRSSKECNSELCTIIKDFDYGPGGYSVFLSVTNGANLTYNISKNYVFKTGYCGDGFCRGNETNATCSQDCESRVNMGVSEATLISNIESVRDKINDSEQINLMSYVLLQVADKFDIIHSREISIAARGFFYGISQFFCFQIDTELKDAEFFSDMASEIEKIRALLSFLSGEIGSKEIKNEIFDIDVDLFTKIKDLKEKYTSKQQTAGGICGGRELGS